MMRALLISNSTSHPTGYLDHCEESMKSFLGDAVKTITFIPFALHDWDAYTKTARDRFERMGYQVRGIHEGGDMKKNVAQAEAFFTGGGNSFRLLTCLYKFDLVAAIRERVQAGAPYMGASAGSNIACATIKTTNDMPIVYPPSFDALALVPFQINPHYLEPDPSSTHKGETREKRLQEFHEENDTPVVGLPEGTMLRVEGGKMTVSGKDLPIRLFQRGKPMATHKIGDDLSFLLTSAASNGSDGEVAAKRAKTGNDE